MKPYLGRAAATGCSQVAAIGFYQRSRIKQYLKTACPEITPSHSQSLLIELHSSCVGSSDDGM